MITCCLPLTPFDSSQSDSGALLNSIMLIISCTLLPWKRVNYVVDSVQVVSTAACAVLGVSLYSTKLAIYAILARVS